MSEQQILEAPAKLVEFNTVEAGLAELRTDLAGVQFDVTTTAGDKAARAARSRCVSIRTSADAAYSDWNKPMLEKQRDMRVKLGEIKEAVKEVEDPIDAQIKEVEKRKAEEKAEREAVEATKRQAVQNDIDAIKDMVFKWSGKPSQVIFAAIEVCQEIEITLDRFGDRAGEAEVAKQKTLTQLQEMHTAAVKHEAEQAQLAADRAALAKEQEDQAKAAAEARRIEDLRLANERAELARQQAAQAQADAEAKKLADAQEAERQAAHDKRQADLKAQQDAIDQQKKELADTQAATEKAEQERLDAIAAEAQAKQDAEVKAAQDKADAVAAAAQKKADAEAAEAARRERVQFEQNGPGANAIIETLAQHYNVQESSVTKWLLEMDLTDAVVAQKKETV